MAAAWKQVQVQPDVALNIDAIAKVHRESIKMLPEDWTSVIPAQSYLEERFCACSLGPETLAPAHVRWRPSDSALCALVAHAEPLLFLVVKMICATPYIVMWEKKRTSCRWDAAW